MSSSLAASLLRRVSCVPYRNRLLSLHIPILAPRAQTATSVNRYGPSRMPSSFIRHASSQASKPGKTNGSADEMLKIAVDSEMRFLNQSPHLTTVVEVPEDFPFTLIDNSGDQSIVIKREYGGEKIEAVVYSNPEEGQEGYGGEDEEDEEAGGGNEAAGIKPTISLVVRIEKGEEGKGQYLEFCCNFNDNELEIESMTTKKHEDPDDGAYEGPAFSDLDKQLRQAIQQYLQRRGFDSSLQDFLQEYMMNKEEREYQAWLNSIQEFVA